MKKMKLIFLGVVVLWILFFAACAGDDAVQKVYTYMDKTLSLVDANKNDPNKAADEVHSYISSIQSQLDSLVNKFENDPEKTKQLAEKLKPLFDKQERILKSNPALRKNIRLQQSLVIFEVLTYTD
jgi:peptidoglycan hydrolase CwlO-like protein